MVFHCFCNMALLCPLFALSSVTDFEYVKLLYCYFTQTSRIHNNAAASISPVHYLTGFLPSSRAAPHGYRRPPTASRPRSSTDRETATETKYKATAAGPAEGAAVIRRHHRAETGPETAVTRPGPGPTDSCDPAWSRSHGQLWSHGRTSCGTRWSRWSGPL